MRRYELEIFILTIDFFWFYFYFLSLRRTLIYHILSYLFWRRKESTFVPLKWRYGISDYCFVEDYVSSNEVCTVAIYCKKINKASRRYTSTPAEHLCRCLEDISSAIIVFLDCKFFATVSRL